MHHKFSNRNASRYELRLTVDRLLQEGRKDQHNQRPQQREPFFKLIGISFPADTKKRRFTCFSRDISSEGMGLLHAMQLHTGAVIITDYSEALGPVRIAGEIKWCQSAGDGWYTSGLLFQNALGDSIPTTFLEREGQE